MVIVSSYLLREHLRSMKMLLFGKQLVLVDGGPGCSLPSSTADKSLRKGPTDLNAVKPELGNPLLETSG